MRQTIRQYRHRCPACGHRLYPIGHCSEHPEPMFPEDRWAIAHEFEVCIAPDRWQQWGWRCQKCGSDFPLDFYGVAVATAVTKQQLFAQPIRASYTPSEEKKTPRLTKTFGK